MTDEMKKQVHAVLHVFPGTKRMKNGQQIPLKLKYNKDCEECKK